MKFDPQRISIKQALLLILGAALLGGPAEYQVICHVGFGPCVTGFQDQIFGMHSMKFSVAMVMLLDALCVLIPIMIVGILVLGITGRPLLQLLRKENKSIDEASARTAAKASRFCAIFIIVLLSIARSQGALRGVGEISMLLMAPGLLLGIFALFGIRNYGTKGILAPALSGIAINGTLLFIFATSFFAARSAAVANPSAVPRSNANASAERRYNPADWKSIRANTPGTYKSESLSFDYPTAYRLKKNNETGQILLEHADSIVVMRCLAEDIDVDCTLNTQLSALEQNYRKDNSCTGFTRSGVEKIDGAIRPGSLMRMEFDDPVMGRCYIDDYCLSGATNYIAVWHIYAEKTKTTSDRLFATVLHSLKDGPVTSPVSGKPATVLAAVPTAAPKGPPELASIMWIPTRPSAQLDKSFAFEGDTVRGYKVTKIRQDSVDLLTPEGAGLKLVLPAQVARSSASNVE